MDEMEGEGLLEVQGASAGGSNNNNSSSSAAEDSSDVRETERLAAAISKQLEQSNEALKQAAKSKVANAVKLRP